MWLENVGIIAPKCSRNVMKRCVLPERKGFLCVLLGGLEGIRASKLTSEAPVGPRKASGVRHMRVGGALSGGASRDRSNISGLADSRPLTCGPTGGSVPNGSGLESASANGSEFTFTPNSSASTPGQTKDNGDPGYDATRFLDSNAQLNRQSCVSNT